MVCVPCILMPFLLFIWHRFIQPLILKFWNPWQQEKEESEVAAMANISKKKATANSCPLKNRSDAQIGAPVLTGKDKDMSTVKDTKRAYLALAKPIVL